jgi:hypothetical protein
VPEPIEMDVTTRGYPTSSTRYKRYTSAVLLLSTWAPLYSLSTITDGVGTETAIVTDETRVRGKSWLHGGTDWDETNANDDHGERGREDYSVVLPEADPGVNVGPSPTDNDPAGINPDLHQDSRRAVPISDHGTWMQVRLVNTTGRCRVRSAVLEAAAAENPAGLSFI